MIVPMMTLFWPSFLQLFSFQWLFWLWVFHNNISLSSNNADDYDFNAKYYSGPLNYYANNYSNHTSTINTFLVLINTSVDDHSPKNNVDD